MGLLTLPLFMLAEAKAFSMLPLDFKRQQGILQISNTNTRALSIEIKVFPSRLVNGSTTAALEPYPDEQARQIVNLKQDRIRLLPRSTRNVAYTILNGASPFFVCALLNQDQYQLRICSRWQP